MRAKVFKIICDFIFIQTTFFETIVNFFRGNLQKSLYFA